MNKLLLSTFTMISLLMFAAGCKTDTSDPKAVAKSFLDAFKARDYEKAATYVTTASKSKFEMMKNALAVSSAQGIKGTDNVFGELFDGKKLDYTEPKINGDTASLSLLVDGQETMPLMMQKEDGSWKVSFDKSALMKSGSNMPLKLPGEINPGKDSLLNLDGPIHDSISESDRPNVVPDSLKK